MKRPKIVRFVDLKTHSGANVLRWFIKYVSPALFIVLFAFCSGPDELFQDEEIVPDGAASDDALKRHPYSENVNQESRISTFKTDIDEDAGQLPNQTTPATVVNVAISDEAQAEFAKIEQQLSANDAFSTSELLANHEVNFTSDLGYDPLTANNLSAIQSSALALNNAENAFLEQNGFVISARQSFADFVDGYKAVYIHHLPVFVTADSILYALHRSYSDILKDLETCSLLIDLRILISSMRSHLQKGDANGLGDEAKADADLYLAVAQSLIDGGEVASPVAGASVELIAHVVQAAQKGRGTETITLFGSDVDIDFSQFAVRGHYMGNADLESYFRAMIWLGRIELALLDPDPVTEQLKFNRRALNAMLALRAVMDDQDMTRWGRIDAVERAFFGEPDSMAPPQVDRLLNELNVNDFASVTGIADDRISAALVEGNFGVQKIASQIVMTPPHKGTLPLRVSFLLLGQRYAVDSYVLSNVVYDRANPDAAVPRRMMPNPLDVAFAALNNDQAAQMLAAELDMYQYAPYLDDMRILVDAHGDAFWRANLYNLWLSSLRALSPTRADLIDPASAGLPSVAATEPWGRRILSTQLASWAELRHDTTPYAKQSYATGAACEFPDVYVDPYPGFFERIGILATAGAALSDKLTNADNPQFGYFLKTYFLNLAEIARILREMAEHQRTGTPHSQEHIDFINRAITVQSICGIEAADGWYAELFYNVFTSTEYDPAIADVHTQPTEEDGSSVGKVLHVATGFPRLMVATVNTCDGPSAYVGVVSAYHEKMTENFQRLDDQSWAERISVSAPPEVTWMNKVVVP